jgi:hypothetical protein
MAEAITANMKANPQPKKASKNDKFHGHTPKGPARAMIFRVSCLVVGKCTFNSLETHLRTERIG